MKGRYKTLLLTYVWLGPLIVIIDQITKWAAYLNRVNVNIIPNFFDLQYTRNTGAAWSILEDYPWVLAIISFLAGTAMIVYYIMKRKTLSAWFRAALMLMIGGTWGNFIDRAFYPEGVIDFLAFDIFGYDFPTFNVADMSLVVGTIALVAIMLIEDRKHDAKSSV